MLDHRTFREWKEEADAEAAEERKKNKQARCVGHCGSADAATCAPQKRMEEQASEDADEKPREGWAAKLGAWAKNNGQDWVQKVVRNFEVTILDVTFRPALNPITLTQTLTLRSPSGTLLST